MAASVAKTDQKKQKHILRKYTVRIFLLKYNDAKKQHLMKVFLIMKYYHSEVTKN